MRFDNADRLDLLVQSWLNLPVFRVTGPDALVRQSLIDNLASLCLKQGLVPAKVLTSTQASCIHSFVLSSDLVLVDESVETDFPLSHTLCVSESDTSSTTEDGTISIPLSRLGEGDLQPVLQQVRSRLNQLIENIPVWACILIGGKSSRMGEPKHLLRDSSGLTWIERAVKVVSPLVSGVVISGDGNLPDSLGALPRLVDIPGIVGPLNGILAASRWQPLVSWMLLACDMPHVTEDAVNWLLSGRKGGCWGRVPRLAGADHCEPLFAWYDIRAAHLFEQQLFAGNLRIGGVGRHDKIANPEIPENVARSWENINTPEQLQLSGLAGDP